MESVPCSRMLLNSNRTCFHSHSFTAWKLTLDLDENMLASSSPDDSHESPPPAELLKKKLKWHKTIIRRDNEWSVLWFATLNLSHTEQATRDKREKKDQLKNDTRSCLFTNVTQRFSHADGIVAI